MTINIIGSDSIKKYIFVKQQGYKDCGCTCLLMIIKYYGGNVSLEHLRELTKTTNNGTNLYNLTETANKIGFNSYGVKANIDSISNDILPIIAHGILDKKYKHFIVIYKINKKKKKILVADPANKLKYISFEEFNDFSSGYFCILEYSKPLQKIEIKNKFKDLIVKYIFHYKKYIICSILFSFIYIVIHLITCYYIQVIIDNTIAYKSFYNLTIISIIFLILFLLKNIFIHIKNNLIISLNEKIDSNLTINVFDHILSLPYFYYKNHPTGEILSRIKDIKEINEVISKSITEIIVNSIIIIISLFMLLILHKIFFSISLLLMFIYFILFYIASLIIDPINKEIHVSTGKINNSLVENISMISTIKNLNINTVIKHKFSFDYKKYLLKNKYFLNKCNNLNTTFNLLDTFGHVTFIFIAVLLIYRKNYNVGFILTYQQIFSYLLLSYKDLLTSVLSIKNTKESFNRIKELYFVKEEVNNHCNINFKGNINIHNLTFSYSKKIIFNNLNLRITPGSKIMLCGNSGVGKSTLAKILFKHIDVARGYVYIDDIDINDYNYSLLRDNICYLSQNEMLITDSIYNNVLLHRKIKYEDFLKASKITLLDDMINTKKISYEMLLEEDGFNLSGGERQKILLTRAILKKSKIYILDEALSEIDIKSERIILKKLFHIYKDKTIIFISHRYDNSDLFDKIINIKNGVCNYG